MNENEKNERETIESWLEEADAYVREDIPENVLEEAGRIIYGDREKTYGSPSKNLQVIADMWTAYLNGATDNLLGGRSFEAKDVAIMMILLKTARLANTPGHRDSIVDICGYAALIERCDE